MRFILRLCVPAAAVAAIAVVSTVSIVSTVSTVGAAPRADNATVKVKTFQFRPSPVEVRAGTKVVWKNRDAIEHTVTSDTGTPAAFDGVLSGKGTSFKMRLNDPGTYTYHCERHPTMKGTVVVR